VNGDLGDEANALASGYLSQGVVAG